MDTGNNLGEELGQLMGQLSAMTQERTPEQTGQILAVTGPLQGQLGPIAGLQSIDFRAGILSCLPTEDGDDPWVSDGPVMITLVVSSEPLDYGYDILGDVQADLTAWAESMELEVVAATNDSDLRTFSFAQFAENSSATIGKEIGMLTSAAMLLLGIILWFNFRSVRETAYVLILTVVAIAATYGLSGWLQFAGVNMTFNAAMNSIPVLLLAIGVDYGLHVVLRVREELKEEEQRNPQGRITLRDFDKTSRQRAIRQGTVLTSIALMIAITTDIVGFLSFRLSTLAFLQVFGTVIAIGLFLIYLLSISALPALMLIFPTKKLPLEKASKVEVGPVALGLGKLSTQPLKVGVIALLLLVPMAAGFQQLEVAFEQRDQLDDSVPVVQDFLLISDEFGTSRSPLYVVIDGDVISATGSMVWTEVYELMSARDDISGVPSGVWNVYEQARLQDPVLDQIMEEAETGDEAAFDTLCRGQCSTRRALKRRRACWRGTANKPCCPSRPTPSAGVKRWTLPRASRRPWTSCPMKLVTITPCASAARPDQRPDNVRRRHRLGPVDRHRGRCHPVHAGGHSHGPKRQRRGGRSAARRRFVDSSHDGRRVGVRHHGLHGLQHQLANRHHRCPFAGTGR